MRKKIIIGSTVLAVLIILLYLCGCSILGLGIGATIEGINPDSLRIEGWNIQTVRPDAKITIVFRDETILNGKYMGLERMPDKEYLEKYTLCREKNQPSVILPQVGDSIFIVNKKERQWKYRFQGFDCNYNICLRPKAPKEPIQFVLSDMYDRIIDGEGNITHIDTLRNLMTEGRIPYRSMMVVKNETGKVLVEINNVNVIIVNNKKNEAFKGFLAGACIDALIIIKNWDLINASSTSSSGEGSCPFVYSYDRKEYILDSETFSGSVTRGLQRTDWDGLEHLKESGGHYSLRILNRLPEIQHIDQMKLMAVDHPAGSRVVPSFSGELHTLSDPQAPVHASELSGTDVLGLVSVKDEQFWLSSPFGRNPDVQSQVRDGLELGFSRPEGSSEVKLFINVQNTLWATQVERQLFMLYGDQLDTWYDAMNHSAAARDKYRNAVEREAMLQIQLWDGETWRESGCIWFVGPHVSKDQAILLDIGDIPGDMLHMRLESTAGLWMIDCVQADYTPDLPLEITELSCTSAADYQGMDLTHALDAIDGQYYEMPTTQDWAELTFQASEIKQAKERTCILKSTGYYTVQASPAGPARWELLYSFSNEPGAFGRYALRELNRQFVSELARIENRPDLQ